jgi:cytidylate kinase
MTIINVTVETGSSGGNIASAVAAHFGLEHVRYRLTDPPSPTPDAGSVLLQRLLETRSLTARQLTARGKRRTRLTELDLIEHACRDNVLLDGFGASILLRSVPQAVSVLVCAPLQERVARIMAEHQITDASQAEALVRGADRRYAAMAERLVGDAEWRSERHYDLVLNTERLGPGACLDLIVTLAGRRRQRRSSATRLALEALHLEARARVAARSQLVEFWRQAADADEPASLPKRRPRGAPSPQH